MNRHARSFVFSTFLYLPTLAAGTAKASMPVPKEAVSKCIAFAKSKGMSVSNASTDRYIDRPGEYFIRVFGSKGRTKNVAATCDWTSRLGGKLTYEDELDFMDH